jgi:hypothetical protein
VTQKALSIRVNVSDRASKVLAQIGAKLLGVGRAIGRMAAGVTRSLGGIGRSLTSLRGLLAGLVALVAVRSLFANINRTAQALDDLAKNARRFGLPVEEFNRLNFIAGQSGASIESVAKGIRTAQRNISDFMQKGTGPAADSLELLGLTARSVTDENGNILEASELLNVLADGISRVENQATRVNVAQSLFGKSGTDLLVLLQQGSAGIEALSGELEALGVVQRSQTDVAEAYIDSQGRVRQAWLVLKAEVIERIGPAMTELANKLAIAIATIAGKFDEFTELLASPFKSGRDARALQRNLADLIGESVRLATPVIAAGVLILVDVLGSAVTFGINQLIPTIAPILTKAFIRMFVQPIDYATGLIADQFKGTALEKSLRSYQANLIEGLEGANEAVDEYFLGDRTQRTFDERLSQVVDSIEDSRTPISEALAAVTAAIGERLPGFQAALERAGGFVSEYQRRWNLLKKSLEAQAAAGDGSGGDDPESGITLLDRFADGANRAGLQVETLGQIADQVGQTVASSLSSGLADAFVSVIDGTERAAAAFRRFAADFLRQIGQMILQALLLRAISGGLGGLGGGSVAGAVANTGGVISSSGRVLKYNAGTGIVPGPNVNRDLIPALLTPGEGVVNRQGVRANPGAIARMNRGESVAGGSVTINQTINVSGETSRQTVGEIKRATAEAVLAALRTRPGMRQSFRQVLA